MNCFQISTPQLLILLLGWVAFGCAERIVAQDANATESAKPLKVLLVAGGCCHDYATQTQLLKQGIEKRIRAEVTIAYNPDTTARAKFEVYESDDWADAYDVILHDECSSDVQERPYIDRILAAHRRGVPAVNLHCAMHSYRSGDFRNPVELGADNAAWYEMLGVQSTAHGPRVPIDVRIISTSQHPITLGISDWTTVDEELYNNVRIFDSAVALLTGDQLIPAKGKGKKNGDAQSQTAHAVVAWTNEYGPNKTKIFSTSLGHVNDTVADDRYLDLVTRGLLWTTGNLTSEGKPADKLAR
jgi:type 1 glutamine amidotransferase